MNLAELDPIECRRLLHEHAEAGGIGRVVVMGRALPQVHPTVYVIDGDEVVLPGDADVLDRRDHDSVLGLQADDLDPLTRTGWSVMAIGMAYPITDRDRAAALARRRPDIWSDIWPDASPA